MVDLNFTSNGPTMTARIVREIENAFLSGELENNGFMFSTRELMQRYCISHTSAERAISILHRWQIVTHIPGKGLKIGEDAKEFVIMQRKHQIEEQVKKLIEDCELLQLTRGELDDMIDKFSR